MHLKTKQNKTLPWLVWLSGLNAGLSTKRSLVRFPVRAHAWVVGQAPRWGRAGGKLSMYLSHIGVSLPLLLPPFPSLYINLFKKLIEIGELLCSYFNIEDGRTYATFLAYYSLLFQET